MKRILIAIIFTSIFITGCKKEPVTHDLPETPDYYTQPNFEVSGLPLEFHTSGERQQILITHTKGWFNSIWHQPDNIPYLSFIITPSLWYSSIQVITVECNFHFADSVDRIKGYIRFFCTFGPPDDPIEQGALNIPFIAYNPKYY